MSSIEEAWAALADVNRDGGTAGHTSGTNGHPAHCGQCGKLRTLALAVLDEAFDLHTHVDAIYVARRDVDKLRKKIEALP